MVNPRDILDFWFGDLGDGATVPAQSKMWFGGGPSVDETIRAHFQGTMDIAVSGGLSSWETALKDRLALVILLDQFSRHLFRGKPQSFAQDERALALSLRTLDADEDSKLLTLERSFLYLPLEHSEDIWVQKRSVESYTRLAKECPPSLRDYVSDNLRYAVRHKEIIERFRRFPHRNAILGRASTSEEIEFLKEPMSFF